MRIGLTVALLVAAGTWLTNVRDGGVPGAIRGLDGLAMLLALVGIVPAWPRRRGGSPARARRARA